MGPYTWHNIHPIFVHFPIALLSAAMVFNLFGLLNRSEGLNFAGWWCHVLGMISVLFTIATGFLADKEIGHMTDPSLPLNLRHGYLQIFSSLIFFGLLIWRGVRKGDLPAGRSASLFLGLGFLATAVMFFGNHLGGKLGGHF